MISFEEIDRANNHEQGDDPRLSNIGKMQWEDGDEDGVAIKYLRRGLHTQRDDMNVQSSLRTLGWDFEKGKALLPGSKTSERVIIVKGNVLKEVQKCQNATSRKASVLDNDGGLVKQSFQSVAPNVAPQHPKPSQSIGNRNAQNIAMRKQRQQQQRR